VSWGAILLEHVRVTSNTAHVTSAVTYFRCHKLIVKVSKKKNSDKKKNNIRNQLEAIKMHFLICLRFMLSICRKFDKVRDSLKVGRFLRHSVYIKFGDPICIDF